ncbi:MAG: hypothetical protein K0R87_2423, partial [Pseudonocardia sp.]|nr:hypothetical protein [Pseudonocardia sp.]
PRADAPNPEQLELADDPDGLVPPVGTGSAAPAPPAAVRGRDGDATDGETRDGAGTANPSARDRS